jgi:hydrogenase maturation protease
MARVLIIGYGNPLRGDDSLGWHAAQRLAETLHREDVDIRTCHQLTPELAEPLSQAALAIFIDASCVGLPGTVRCDQMLPNLAAVSDFTHHFDIPALLACAQILYGLCPPAVLCSVAAESFDLSENLTATVSAALPKVIDCVHDCIAQL